MPDETRPAPTSTLPAVGEPPAVTADPAVTGEDVRRIVREEIERAFRRDPATRTAAIIASKGTLDWAYPPLILANAAAAVGMDVSVFFTFYGLNIIHKDAARKLKIDPVGNPAMPMPVRIPDIISSLPGMVPMASAMMRSKFAKKHVATIGELLDRRRRVRRRRRLHGPRPPGTRHPVRLTGGRPTMQQITEDQLVDARDLMCPMPVMAATKAMRRLQPNQVLKILATDRGSLSDIPAWAEANGDELLDAGEDNGVYVFYVRKADQE